MGFVCLVRLYIGLNGNLSPVVESIVSFTSC